MLLVMFKRTVFLRLRRSKAKRLLSKIRGALGRQAHRIFRSNPKASLPRIEYLHGYEGARPRVPWPAFPPPQYLNQLEDSFQTSLADDRAFITQEDCIFYHTAVLPNGEVISGPWDLRGREAEYLGGVRLAGRRILEFGPATGHLTYFMEKHGADVVCFEAGWDRSVDLLPSPDVDPSWAQMDAMRYIGATQNSWWFLHREYQSRTRMVYGDIYRLPADLGQFDVATFGAILLHLENPFAALAQAAKRVTSELVVTEPLQDEKSDPLLNRIEFAPQDVQYTTHWWSLSPGAVVRMLERLGFGETSVTYHVQKHHFGHDLTQPAGDMKMYTVVARRLEA